MLILTPDPRFVLEGREGSPSDGAVVRESWVENVYRVSAADVEGGMVVDLGANIGAFSTFAMSLGADVVAVEPEPENRALLERNLAANGAGCSFQVLPVAVTDSRGRVRLDPAHGGSRLSEFGLVEVDAVTLADVFDVAGECSVLKVDVEGCEYPLLIGAGSEVLRRARYITVEFDAEPESGLFGDLVTVLAREFSVEVLGSPDRGGYIYAHRYD